MTKSHDALWTDVARVAKKHGQRLHVDTDDLAQSLALALLTQGSRPAEPAPWLERVARNLAVTSWRRQRRERPWPARDERDARPCETPLAFERLASEEERLLVLRARETLSSQEQAMLDARFGAPTTNEDCGAPATCEQTPRTATERTRLRRLLLRLRRELGALRAWLAPALPSSGGASAAAMAGWMAPVVLAGLMSAASVGHQGQRLQTSRTAAWVPTAGRASTVSSEQGAEKGRTSARPRLLLAAESRPSKAGGTMRATSIAAAPPKASASQEAAPQRFDYDDDVVDGALARPEGILLEGSTTTKKASLIELRRDLLPELLKGLEDLG